MFADFCKKYIALTVLSENAPVERKNGGFSLKSLFFHEKREKTPGNCSKQMTAGRRVSTRPAESGTEQSKNNVDIAPKQMLCDVGSSGAAGVARVFTASILMLATQAAGL